MCNSKEWKGVEGALTIERLEIEKGGGGRHFGRGLKMGSIV